MGSEEGGRCGGLEKEVARQEVGQVGLMVIAEKLSVRWVFISSILWNVMSMAGVCEEESRRLQGRHQSAGCCHKTRARRRSDCAWHGAAGNRKACGGEGRGGVRTARERALNLGDWKGCGDGGMCAGAGIQKCAA